VGRGRHTGEDGQLVPGGGQPGAPPGQAAQVDLYQMAEFCPGLLQALFRVIKETQLFVDVGLGARHQLRRRLYGTGGKSQAPGDGVIDLPGEILEALRQGGQLGLALGLGGGRCGRGFRWHFAIQTLPEFLMIILDTLGIVRRFFRNEIQLPDIQGFVVGHCGGPPEDGDPPFHVGKEPDRFQAGLYLLENLLAPGIVAVGQDVEKAPLAECRQPGFDVRPVLVEMLQDHSFPAGEEVKLLLVLRGDVEIAPVHVFRIIRPVVLEPVPVVSAEFFHSLGPGVVQGADAGRFGTVGGSGDEMPGILQVGERMYFLPPFIAQGGISLPQGVAFPSRTSEGSLVSERHDGKGRRVGNDGEDIAPSLPEPVSEDIDGLGDGADAKLHG